jgi:hypothetical protein
MPAPALNIPVRAAGLDDFKKQMSDTSALVGTATRAITSQVIKMNAGFLASQGAAGAATLAFGSLLGVLGPIMLGITAVSDAFKLMGYATDLAKQKIADYNAIADKASTVSADFYQRIVKSAATAKLSVDDLTAAFHTLNAATAEKLGGSDLQNRIDELQKAGNLAGNTGVGSLASANGTEEKFRAIVGLIDQAMQKGERLAGLDIAGKAFGPQIATALAADSGYLDQMLQRADAINKSEIISPDDIGRAVELKERMDAAQQVLADKWKPIQDDLATLGMNYHASWVTITEDLAAAVGYATDLYKALHQVPDWFANRIGNASIWQSLTDATTTPESRKASEDSLGISSDPKDIGMVSATDKLRAALQNHGNVTRSMSEATTVQSAVRGDTSKDPNKKDTSDQNDAVDRGINTLRRHTEQQEADTQAVGLGDAALAKFRAQAQETSAVQANGGKETAEQAAQFKTLEDRAGAAADALAKAKLNSQISFGKQTAFLTPEDVQIASQLKGIYGDDVPKALNSSEAAALRLNNTLKGTSDAFQNSINGPLLDFETGAKSAGSAMKDFETQFVRSLLSMANQALIIKPLMSGIGGLFGLGSIAGAGALPLPGSGSFIGPVAKADGGMISGPGTGTSDSIHARLSDGEFVVKASETAKNRSLLEAINGGRIPKFADGGMVSGLGSPSSGAPMIGGQTTHIAPMINVTVHGSPGQSPQDHARMGAAVAKAAGQHIQAMIGDEIRKQGRPGGILFRR